jgi:hypothetical protein
LHDAFANNAPCAEGFNAEQDKGAYSFHIRGVPGAYFIESMNVTAREFSTTSIV